MRFLLTLTSVAAFAALGFLAVMLAAQNGLAPCPTCRDLLTPNQGGLIYAQAAGVLIGAALGGLVAWLTGRALKVKRRMPSARR